MVVSLALLARVLQMYNYSLTVGYRIYFDTFVYISLPQLTCTNVAPTCTNHGSPFLSPPQPDPTRPLGGSGAERLRFRAARPNASWVT